MSFVTVAQWVQLLGTGRVLVVGVFLFFFGSFIVDFTWKPRYPKSLPRVGYGDGVFATMKNWLGYVLHFNDWVAEGYQKYSKHGRAFVVPSAASRPNEIVVPRSSTRWLVEAPERALSTHEAHEDVMYTQYNFLGADDRFPIGVIHRHLARNLVPLIPGIQEEVEAAVDAALSRSLDATGAATPVPDSEGWFTVSLWELWLAIVPRVTNRLLVGAPACRDEAFLAHMVQFADTVVRNSFILNMFPKILHPVVGRVVALPNWWHWWKASRIVQPTIEERLRSMASKQPRRRDSGFDTLPSGELEAEEDFITWLIRQAVADGNLHELDPSRLSQRILPVEFAAIHTTVITGHSLILDLLSSDPSSGYLDAIREETDRVLREECDGTWTKNGLSRLYRTDSAIKESMRRSNFATSLTKKKVVAPEGITNPIEGWHAPYGATLMLDLADIHHDPDIYDRPEDYDAFRFARIREQFEARPPGERDPEEGLRVMKQGMVTTSDTYLAFGHGRHACPGRFFVAHELKMILAHLLRHYDLKPLAERPQPQWIGQTIIPPIQATIQVRRRKLAGA
ncbi:hypothetical protein VTK73DRAFT_5397 [Phialemonium thermophilum]|uniref:Cytochrome P450 n=1 Tax=Phialemonium thermophilum TaxID=223376 RepID=A0ABR3XX67_9PEZI